MFSLAGFSLQKSNLLLKVGNQFRIEFLRVAARLRERRLGIGQRLGIFLSRLIQLRRPILSVYFFGKLFPKFLTQFFRLFPLPGANQVVSLIAQVVKVFYIPAVKKRKHIVFIQDSAALASLFGSLKSMKCPFCERAGFLNRHSLMRGNNPDANTGFVVRGQRVFCSNRGRRGGCGRTFPVMFDWALPGHTFTAVLLWQAVLRRLDGLSLRAAWHSVKSPLALDSFYHLLQRVRRRLTPLRTALSSAIAPPRSKRSDPLLQTFEHLTAAFPNEACPIRSFQRSFQRPFAG